AYHRASWLANADARRKGRSSADSHPSRRARRRVRSGRGAGAPRSLAGTTSRSSVGAKWLPRCACTHMPRSVRCRISREEAAAEPSSRPSPICLLVMSHFRTIMSITSAVLLFIYGLQALSREIQEVGEGVFQSLTERLTKTRVRGYFLGLLLTVLSNRRPRFR